MSIVVRKKKTGVYLYCFGSIMMSLVCVICVIFDFRSYSGLWGAMTQNIVIYMILKMILFVGIFFFGYAFYFNIKQSKEGKSVLIVDEKGIIDESSAISFGFIPWKDIDDIHLGRTLGQQFIELAIHNEDEYIDRFSGIKKQSILTNKKMGHEIVCITLNGTGVSINDIFPEIMKMYQTYKRT